jgi:hypothetical protein
MDYLLCRNRVRDFAIWKNVFDSHAAGHRAAGLKLVNLWRAIDEVNNVFFLFEVSSAEDARAFISTPEAANAGKESGVIDGEYHFLRKGEGY